LNKTIWYGRKLLAGRLGDLIGRKRIFLIGLTAFTLASLLCGASGTPEMLVVARFVPASPSR